MKRILLVGKNGQIGWELERTLGPLGKVIAVDRQVMDLAKPETIVATIRDVKPELIVNAAAYTAVDKAESEPELAMAINGIAPGIMAEEAKRLGISLIHYSTDYVFDGTKAEPYTEGDSPNPLSIYGKSKLAGEHAIQGADIPHVILRTSWVYGGRGKNFLRTILRIAQERDELKIVSDQVGAPTWSRMIAEATSQVILQMFTVSKPDEFSGIYHLTATGQTSWFGFARFLMELASRHGACVSPKITPIPTADYPLPAPRPRNSVMSNKKLGDMFDIQLPAWDASVEMCVNDFAGLLHTGMVD